MQRGGFTTITRALRQFHRQRMRTANAQLILNLNKLKLTIRMSLKEIGQVNRFLISIFVPARVDQSEFGQLDNADRRAHQISSPTRAGSDTVTYLAYIHITGPSFDAESFERAYGRQLGGKASVRKHLRSDKSVSIRYAGWLIEASALAMSEVEAKLTEMINQAKPILIKVKVELDLEIYVAVVQSVTSYEDATGIFINRELISSIKEIGAGFEYDISLRGRSAIRPPTV